MPADIDENTLFFTFVCVRESLLSRSDRQPGEGMPLRRGFYARTVLSAACNVVTPKPYEVQDTVKDVRTRYPHSSSASTV